jgi:hypothetical protein
MKGAVAIPFWLRHVIARSRDRPISPQSPGNSIGSPLIRKDRPDAADVRHTRQLHPRLPHELARDGRCALQTLGDDGVTLAADVVPQVGCHSREWFGVLGAPPLNHLHRAPRPSELGRIIKDVWGDRETRDLIRKVSTLSIDPRLAVARHRPNRNRRGVLRAGAENQKRRRSAAPTRTRSVQPDDPDADPARAAADRRFVFAGRDFDRGRHQAGEGAELVARGQGDVGRFAFGADRW